MKDVVHLIGFGSQGAAWGANLRASGREVNVYLSRKAASWDRAVAEGFSPRLLKDFRPEGDSTQLVAMLCPDLLIGPIYRDHFAAIEQPMTFVLAHGYTIYSRDLKMANLNHAVALLAPKAIGPKLREAYVKNKPHSLSAGFCAPPDREAQIAELAMDLGFDADHLIDASFDEEAKGDLISEQGLLCGGVFTLLEWTMEAMAKAGVPDALIREECLTELELVAGLLREKGPASTFKKISEAAQCGTIAMRKRLEDAGTRAAVEAQFQTVVDGTFADELRGAEWKKRAEEFVANLSRWEARLK